MDDNSIIDLYFDRSEAAITETDAKYGRYCFHIAENILNNFEDSEESVNDTYLAAWRTIPPKRPNRLAVYLGKMTRNISLDRWKRLQNGLIAQRARSRPCYTAPGGNEENVGEGGNRVVPDMGHLCRIPEPRNCTVLPLGCSGAMSVPGYDAL